MSEEKEQLEEQLSAGSSATEQEMTESNIEANDPGATEEMKEVEEEIDVLAQLEEEKRELQDKYIRLYSEFENFRRRTAKEKQDLRLTASQDLIVELLSVVDDFERGLDAMSKVDDVKTAAEGVSLVFNKLKGILEKKGLKAMDCKEKDFDLELHEALTKFPSPNPEMKGKVLEEIEKGYLLHDKVIRHAKVVVAE